MDDLRELTFTLNGRPLTATVDGRKSLLRFVRDDLGQTGTKDGCASGDCGSCVVLVDGKPVDSCVFLMRRADGTRIETIEGLAGPDGTLHPIQAAFLDRGAVQCGFCTPGMIMASKSLLDANPSPSADEIRRGLKDNMCRCTGYSQIVEAVQQAAAWMADPEGFAPWRPTRGGLGTPTVIVDGEKSVQGTLPFADDVVLPGMLQAAVVWAGHPYARILGVDAEAARSAPGVDRVVTAADVPGLNAHGIFVADQPVLCDEYVRFTGDPIAVVLADTREHAAAAVKLVRVDYEPLAGLFSPADALREGAPQLTASSPGNVCQRVAHATGDVGAAFASAAHIVQGHFRTQRQDHAYLEPLAALADVSDDGTITVWTPTQSPFEVRDQLAKILDQPKERIRVIGTPPGGSFGGKMDMALEGLVAVSAWAARRPVKLTLSRAESHQTSVKRHPFELDYRVAADGEGRLLGVEATLVSDCGPYIGHSQRVIDEACIFACGPYRVPSLRVEGTAVMTNNPLSGPFRGFGINQAAVAMESLLDEMALELDMDPFELRRKNMLVEGDYTNTGQYLPNSVGAVPTLDACQAAFEEEWPTYRAMARPGYRVGYGVAAATKNCGAGKGKREDGGAIFTLKADGRVELRATVVDMGQAIRTTMIQLACQATGIDFELFDILSQDTGLTHPHKSAAGQRQTLASGNAVVIAGETFRSMILDLVRDWTGREGEALAISGDEIRSPGTDNEPPEMVMTLRQAARLAAAQEIAVTAEKVYVLPQTWPLADEEALRTVPREEYRNYPTFNYATHVAIVGVEEATGRVDVLRVIAAHDCGTPINPLQIRGQLIGSVAMGQGYALSENYPTVEGRPPWRRIDYRRLGVPTILDAASVRVEIVEDPFPEGPFGAKAVSEVATVPATPAILNAIRQATGVRIHETPVDPRRLREAMAGGAGSPGEGGHQS
jgi:CO/xanthine dehydrogenase Mo-binding subunit/aerobic-type carbon monoxide dehydrogenase small subunit (CoxS/CutS family)